MNNNRPLYRTAIRRIQQRPLQTILFIVGVAIGVAMMVSIDIASRSASRAFQLSTDAITGKATHRITADEAGVDEALYTQLRVQQGIVPSAPVVEGYVLAHELGGQNLQLMGVDLFAEPPFRDYLGQNSRFNSDFLLFLSQPNTAVLAEPLATRYNLALGDTLTIELNGRQHHLAIIGLLQPSDDATRESLNTLIFTDIANAQQILGMHGRLSHIDLILPDDAVAPLAETLPPAVRLEPAAANSQTIRQMTAAFELNLTALSFLALVVGMFLIYNTVNFSVVQRRPLFGILRSLGVTSTQLFQLIWVEALVLSFIGSLLGLLLGVILGRGMVNLVTQTINDLYFVVNVQNMTISPISFVRGMGLGIATSLVASAIPAWEAMQTVPTTVMHRSSLEGRTRRFLPWMLLAWVVFSVVGWALLQFSTSLIVAFAGLFTTLFAFAMLTPPFTAVFLPLITPLTYKLFGVIGRMAPRDITRSLSRTSVAIAALMITISVVVGVSVMIGSFRSTVDVWLRETLVADIFFTAPRLTNSDTAGILPPDVLPTAVAHPAVDHIATTRELNILLPEFNQQAELLAIQGDSSDGRRRYVWQASPTADIWAKLEAGEGVFITEPLYLKENLPLPPPPITVPTPQGERQFEVLAILYDYTSDQPRVYIDHLLYKQLWQDDNLSNIGLFLKPDQDLQAVIADLQATFHGRSDLLIQSNQNVRDSAMVIFDRTFAITHALRLLNVFVAFIGVLSAMMSLQLERSRELGILQALGMTQRQLWGLTLLQTGLMGGLAGLLAAPTGYVLARILVDIINVRSFGWTLQLDPQPIYFIQALTLAVLAALLAGLYPSYRLGKMVIATAVRQE